jgi:two-component system cell cycle response regulator DivK
MGKKILVVEDNERNRSLIADVLTYHGYEVISAVNGEEGVKMALEHGPDLILMDVQMPVMNGHDALGILKANPETRNIKIIALTSFAMRGDSIRLIEAGFDGYIAKPIDTRKLPIIIENLLNLTTEGE